MKLIVLYRPNSEYARVVEQFVREFEQRGNGIQIDLVDFDTPAAQATSALYGVMQHPSILAVRDDGQLMKQWQGPEMPLQDEVASYLH
jgi:hypothetical protein